MPTRRMVWLLALVSAGCASAPAYRAPEVALPVAFRERADRGPEPASPGGARILGGPTAPPRSEFWRALGDPTLDRLVELALRENHDVQVAEARIRGARAARREASFDLAPTVTAGAGYTRQRIASASFPGASGSFPDQSVWDVGFDAGWELDLFGRVRNSVRAQGALFEAANHDLRDIQVALVAELARTYFDLRGAQGQLAVALRNAENQRRTLSLVQDRLATGIGSAFDTERAQAQLSSTLAVVPALEAQVAAAQYRVGVLIGRSPTAVARELEGGGELPSLPGEVAVDNPDTLIRRRPDVAAAERRAASAVALVGASRATLLPRLSLGGSVGLSASGADRLGESGTFRYAVGPVVSWPAFNLGRVKAQVDASRAFEQETRARYQQTVLLALEEVEASLARYRTGRARVDRIREAAEASGRAAELARTRFAEGLADFLQVLDAERTQLDAEIQLAAARTTAATAYASLYKALGGDLR